MFLIILLPNFKKGAKFEKIDSLQILRKFKQKFYWAENDDVRNCIDNLYKKKKIYIKKVNSIPIE